MSFIRDRQVRWYCIFLVSFSILIIGAALLWNILQLNQTKTIYIIQNEKMVSSLLEQGVSSEIIANALCNGQVSKEGKELLAIMGMEQPSDFSKIPWFSHFQQSVITNTIILFSMFIILLLGGTAVFFCKRSRLYLQAEKAVTGFLNGDFSCHLPQNQEGLVYQMFSAVEQLATILRSQNETEQKTKEFLKNTISDISHQLKTPLAAMAMYQEIIESEFNHAETVREFSAKIGISLNRMKQLIQSMLKITRLDTGNIVFEKQNISVWELVNRSINDLIVRAEQEKKKIVLEGDADGKLRCDMPWTGEAIGNIVKNALDHTKEEECIKITWENTPVMTQITISDNGDGIAPEDIHHIFKRFYRSKHTLETPGIGLGLSLAKSIVEGQGGFLSVQSELHVGTAFTISFPYEIVS